jgi:hypothetical protein
MAKTWWKGGRIDPALFSSRTPNFGLDERGSGPRAGTKLRHYPLTVLLALLRLLLAFYLAHALVSYGRLPAVAGASDIFRATELLAFKI